MRKRNFPALKNSTAKYNAWASNPASAVGDSVASMAPRVICISLSPAALLAKDASGPTPNKEQTHTRSPPTIAPNNQKHAPARRALEVRGPLSRGAIKQPTWARNE